MNMMESKIHGIKSYQDKLSHFVDVINKTDLSNNTICLVGKKTHIEIDERQQLIFSEIIIFSLQYMSSIGQRRSSRV